MLASADGLELAPLGVLRLAVLVFCSALGLTLAYTLSPAGRGSGSGSGSGFGSGFGSGSGSGDGYGKPLNQKSEEEPLLAEMVLVKSTTTMRKTYE